MLYTVDLWFIFDYKRMADVVPPDPAATLAVVADDSYDSGMEQLKAYD